MVAVLGLVLVTGVAEGKPRACAPEGARVHATGAKLQVYRHRGRMYACHRHTGTRRALADDLAPAVLWLSSIRVAGDLVGHGVVVSRGDDLPLVGVRNIRTGALVHLAEAVTPMGRRDDKLRAFVRDLVLHPSGDVAWIAQNANVWPARFEVYKIDGAAGRVMLAASTAIHPDSLLLHGRTISWIAGDDRRFARLR